MNPLIGDLIEHRIGGGIYKVKAVFQLVDTPEVYLWRGIIENMSTNDCIPYSLSKASYWETFWNHISTSKPKFKVGNRCNPITNTISTPECIPEGEMFI